MYNKSKVFLEKSWKRRLMMDRYKLSITGMSLFYAKEHTMMNSSWICTVEFYHILQNE
jgi:hypothetical protein